MTRILASLMTVAFLSNPVAAPAQDSSAADEAIRLTNFGVEAARKGLWKEASIRWQQALKVFPNFPAAHNNLAVVFEHFGKYELAKDHYGKAVGITDSNRYIGSNNRMFQQFYYKHIQSLQEEKQRREQMKKEYLLNSSASLGSSGANDRTGPNTDRLAEVSAQIDNSDIAKAGVDSMYYKTGSSKQVFITHPKRSTPMSEKYRRVYFAGFVPTGTDEERQENMNFETTEFLRSELRKWATYEVVALDELNLPTDEEEFDQLIDDDEFWARLGNKVGADLIIYGLINFYDEPSDGFLPYEYRDGRGNYRTARQYVQRTAFVIELDLFFHEAATGELVHQESFGQTIVYRGRLNPNLQSFYDVMNRVLPRFMDLMVPREHDAIRFLLYG